MEHTKLDELIRDASTKLNESFENIDSMKQWKTQMFTLINEIAELKLQSSPRVVTKINTSLDPADWLSTRSITHKLLDSLLNFIETVRDRPVWVPIPTNVRVTLESESLPEHEQSLSDVCQHVLNYVLPYSLGNTHPRFWGWVMGEGTIGGVLAEMIAATINANIGGRTQASVLVERTVIKWMRQLFGFPEGNTAGLVTTGTSMSTVISLATARQRTIGYVRKDGLVNGAQLVAYASTEVHICVPKALELLGIGSNALRRVSVDENFSINTDELKRRIQLDRDNGFIPFCIIGNAGTVNTGAFDNLLELSAIAHSENIWFHVDGAFGSLVILDPQRQHLVSGIDQADSLAFDFHKWLHCPYDAGCVLIRDGTLLLSTFSAQQSYLLNFERGVAGDAPWSLNLGPEASRSSRALKVWFTLKEHGTKQLAKKIAENCEQAQYLASLLEKCDAQIRIVRPISLNIVNFRFEPDELDKENSKIVDDFNNELVADIQLSGIAVPSTAHIGGRLYIRVAIVSHRCTLQDFHLFVETLSKLCRDRLQATTQKSLAND